VSAERSPTIENDALMLFVELDRELRVFKREANQILFRPLQSDLCSIHL